jgi:peptidoglycan/LPS O-acetylase OafA/YrhL
LPGWPQIAANLTGLNNIVTGTLPQNAPLWSLAYEIWFYVFAGAIGYTLSTNAVHPASLLAVACAVAIVSASSPFYLLFWCIGAAAVFAMQYRFKTLLAISGIFLFTAGCICYELAVQSRSITSINLLPLPVSEAFICIGIALAIPKLCTDKANAALKPVRRAIIGLSAMSYSLYLVHYPLNCALNLWLPKAAFLSPQSIAALFFRTALVFAGCLVFYFCFEVHTKLVRRIFQHTPLTETGESRAIN